MWVARFIIQPVCSQKMSLLYQWARRLGSPQSQSEHGGLPLPGMKEQSSSPWPISTVTYLFFRSLTHAHIYRYIFLQPNGHAISSGSVLMAPENGGPGSIPGQPTWDLSWTKWHWKSTFQVPIFIPPMFYTVTHYLRLVQHDPFVATQTHPTLNKKIIFIKPYVYLPILYKYLDSKTINMIVQTGNEVIPGLKCWKLSKLCIQQDPLNYGISTSCQQQQATHHHVMCVTRQTQTEHRVPKWQQLLYCLAGDDAYRRQRQREAAHAAAVTGSRGTGDGGLISRHVNSVSYIDKAARILFPASFGLLNLFYWVAYYTYQEEFDWRDPPITPFSY